MTSGPEGPYEISASLRYTAFWAAKGSLKLRDRRRREKQEQYEWLRLMLRAPTTLSATELARLACRMYRKRLIWARLRADGCPLE